MARRCHAEPVTRTTSRTEHRTERPTEKLGKLDLKHWDGHCGRVMARNRSGDSSAAGRTDLLADTGLVRPARYLQRGEPSDDGREIHHKGGRQAEEFYRERWRHDKIVRSTHGVNCTGSCSWQVYVKDGIITWETQAVDYPSVGPDSPEYEPRGCPSGASFSWYTYSPARVRYPYVRGELLELWREARSRLDDPVAAWADLMPAYQVSLGFTRETLPAPGTRQCRVQSPRVTRAARRPANATPRLGAESGRRSAPGSLHGPLRPRGAR